MKTLVIVDDYHDFELIISAMVGKVKHIELGTIITPCHFYKKYIGIIYEGRKPTSSDINDLLFRAKIKKTDNDDEYVQC